MCRMTTQQEGKTTTSEQSSGCLEASTDSDGSLRLGVNGLESGLKDVFLRKTRLPLDI